MARSKTRWNRTLRWLVFATMLANLFLVGIAPAAAQGPSPGFLAHPEQDQLSGWEWQPNSSVTVTIDGSITGASTDEAGYFDLYLDGFDLQPGQSVTVSDGSSTKHHTVTNLAVTAVDAGADTVSGTADAGSQVQVWICDEGGCANREEAADSSGYWTADFSIPGDQDGEQDTRDIQPGTGGDAAQHDEDGDGTQVRWRVPDPTFAAHPDQDRVVGWEWQPNSSVTVTIDGSITGASTDESGNFDLYLEGFDLQPGQSVTVSDGSSTKYHTVTNLAVTAVDAGADTVSGTADAGSQVQVWICDEWGCASREETADSSGFWTADFSVPGDQDGEQDIRDIRPGTGGDAAEGDNDGDSTQVGWRVPNPRFEARPEEDQIDGWEWPPGAMLSLSINGADPFTQNADGDGNVSFGLQGTVDLQVGDVVTFSDLDTTKEHTVLNLAVTGVDPDTDTVSGTAGAGSEITVWTHEGGGNLQVTADVDGNWSADLSEWVNLEPGWGGVAAIHDLDQDSTAVYWWIPNPRFEARPEEDRVEGWEWQAGVEVTLSIGSYSATQMADEWGNVGIDLQGSFDIQVGDVATLNDGTSTKEHTVLNLVVTNVDPVADTVSGTADAGSEITVWTHDGAANLQVTADSGGYWLADLSGQVDLQPGSGGGTAIHDVDQDSTAVYWWIPNPRFEARPEEEQVDGWEWQPGAPVTLSIDGATGEDYGEVQEADEWGNVSFSLQGNFDIQVGDFVTLGDGTSTKEHTVVNLDVTGMDPATDTIWGTADAGSQITIWTHEGGANVQVTANEEGDWSVDLSDQVDLQPGSGGGAAIYDAEQDSTTVYWWISNPRFEMVPDEDILYGWEWQPNSSVTVTVDGYTTGASTDEAGNFDLYLDGFDLQPGHYVTVSDGSSTKYHTVTNLVVTAVDTDAETVSGTADPDTNVDVWSCDDQGCANRYVVAEGGTWIADFASEGPGEDEKDIFDIVKGTGGGAAQHDEDGDGTQVGWRVPDPTFAAHPDQDRVEGWEWPFGETVTLEIDDPDTPENPDYTDEQLVEIAEWDPDQTYVEFNFEGLFNLRPGHVVTLSAGATTKEHIVTNLATTEVDADADTVSGTADPGSNVHVWSCDDQGCANRHVVAEGGTWIADFAIAGPGEDEQDILDIVKGTGGDAAQHDEDGDRTQIRWELAYPRLEVSYEHDWIQIRGFTPGGKVTYTIFDYEGGHALFGPVTGPVDSHGDGWISGNLHHTDLIPGYYVTAANEASGEEVSLLIRNVNLDYVGAEDDIAYGTAEPNSTIELNINETHDHGFNLTVPVDGDGNWYVDLAAAGHPIDEYRHANANLYDEEGDQITAQNPRIHAYVSTDHFNVDNFSKNADVTVALYDSPGGDPLYGPVTLHTQGNGSAGVNLWELGIDLQVGHYITAYDHTLGFTKALEIELFTFDVMNTAEDYVQGTSLVDEWVELHVESLFSNWGTDAFTNESGNWYRDYGIEDYDITDQMWGYGWAIDDQGNWSEDHITGLPNIEASPADDWISGWNFTPERPVRIRIYDSENGNLLKEMETTADGNTQFQVEGWEHGVDLQPGMYLYVEDLETGKSSSLTLAYLTFDGVDYGAETAYGQADEGTQVVVRADWFFEHYEVVATAETDGSWSADFDAYGVDLTPDWSLRAMVFDLELDATVADAPRPPEFTAAFDQDWVSGNNWSPGAEIQIDVFENDEATDPLGTVFWNTDEYGGFHADLWGTSIDLQPGQYIVVTDAATGRTKETTLVDLTIEGVDPELDLVTGLAPGEARISVYCWNDSFYDGFDLFSQADGTWLADFGAHDIDLTPDTSCDARIYDPDNDATQANWHVSTPTFAAQPVDDVVQGWQWPLDAEITVTIEQDGDPEPECTAITYVGMAPWDSQSTWFRAEFQGECDLVEGDTVTVSDGQTTKTHVVTGLEVHGVDAENDTVFGIAAAGSEVSLWIHGEPNTNLSVPADGSGNWTADFTGTFDLQPGTGGAAVQQDDDGDQTWIDWRIPNPHFLVRLTEGEVHGYDWPLGEEVTVEIDDPDTPEVEFTDTQTVVVAEWNPDETWVRFNYGGLDVQEGFLVTMTHGETTKTHTVTPLSPVSIDEDEDIVSGMATAYAEVSVYVWNGSNASRWVLAAESGEWMADFSEPGQGDGEQDTFDIGPGTNGEAIEEDEDGDGTQVGWNLVFPPTCEPGDSVSGTVFEVNGVTPIPYATVYVDDYDTGEQICQVTTAEDGTYGFFLPDDSYCLWAIGGAYSREYYQEAIYEHATEVEVVAGTALSNVDFTLDIPIVTYDHFTFNLTDPVVSDPAVRQAIAYGTDRARIIAETFPGSPMMHSYLNPDHWAADYDQMPQYGFNPALAAQILTDAGWVDEDNDGVREKDGQELHIVYVTTQLPPDHFRHTIYQIFVENMADLGVEVEVIMTSEVWDRVFQRHDFGIAQFAWTIDVNDDTWPGMIFTSDHDLNCGLYSRQEVDEALKEALDYGTRAGKLPYMITSQQFVMEDLATLPLLMRVTGNQPPTIESITAPVDPVTISAQPVSVEVTFSDPDEGDTHTVTWTWGDGSNDTQFNATSPVLAEHIYAEPGVYPVEVTVTDSAGASDTATYEFIVIYDPEGGFVTGGGWIWSPAGAYAADPTLEGKASFGFVSKYKKGANVPEGQTQFQFKAGDLSFHSDSYEWLVVAGAKAMFKGVGTINGAGNYGFMLSAIDSALTPSTDVDLFRIKIWDRDNGDVVVYDNLMGASDDADPTTALGGGNIVVHKAK